jgi:hypothetical protein
VKRWRVIVLLLLTLGTTALVSLLLTRTTPASPTQHGVAADFDAVVGSGPAAYGVNVWWTDQDAALWTARWAELGSSWVRLYVSHALVEPENDDADPQHINWAGFRFDTPISVPAMMTHTLTYRDWFTALRDQPDVHILIHFSYLAPWLTDNPPHPSIPIPAAPYPPNDLAEYREFIEATARFLVEEVDFPPERIAFEVMNEPDLECGADPVTPCFWQDWTMNDIRAVVSVTWQAVQDVAPAITLVGLAECCGTSIARDLLDHYPEGAYLDGLSYHYYAPGNDLSTALNRAAELAPYGRPIYLDEYGSLQYRSDGADGALWHSLALATLWRAGIAPIQYPVSEWPLLGEPYNSMGLFDDWRGGWMRKPSYWVYTNFFRFVGGGEVISHTAPAGLDVLVSRRTAADEAQVAFWVVNRGTSSLPDITFTLHQFPAAATLHIYDNLVGPSLLVTETVSGAPLIFTATLPARSSRAFVLSANLLPPFLDYVLLTPDRAARTAGRAISYTLTAYDTLGRHWDATRMGVYTITPNAGGLWTGSRYTTEATGTWTVAGAYEERADTAILIVWQPLVETYLPLTLRGWQ